MGKQLSRFWREERGNVPVTEWMFVATILTLGTIAGMLAFQHWEADRADEPPPSLSR